jgi:CDP-4-dehydro-6-deoxyglucose reductase
MILDIYNNKISHGTIYLLFGCRTKQDLLYYNEFRELEKDPLFHYLPVLSRETWEGISGYVHAVYEKICENRPPASFYLCGWRGMINEARERIEKMGYDRKALHFELFG